MKTQYQIILLIIVIIIAALVGYYPEHLKVKSLEATIQKNEEAFNQQSKALKEEKEILNNRLEFSRIKEILSEVILETDKKNYGIALERFKNFIEKWENFKDNPIVKDKIADSDIKRDEIVSDLSKGDAGVKGKLVAIYEKFLTIQ